MLKRIGSIFLLFSVLLANGTGKPVVADEETRLQAVVKVHSKNRLISLTSPWRKETPRSVSGSGVIIGKGLVMTNAHVILNTTQVTLQPIDSSERIPAKVKVFAPGIDLAILEFEPEGTLVDIAPLEFAKATPEVQSTVRVFGYPTGGDTQSVTEGIISRIEHTSYRYGSVGMRIQIDAAINSGNSGGPAIVDGKIAGIAFSMRRDANDIGYVIPVEEINKFMADVEDGVYVGKPKFNCSYQYLENRSLREKLQVSADVTGVLCRGMRGYDDPPLKEGDIITEVAGVNVDNRGRCRTDNDIVLTFTRLAIESAKDGVVKVGIIRDGAPQMLSVPVQTRRRLVDYITGQTPRYFVYGPVVFSEATADYLNALDSGANSSSSSQRRAMIAAKTMMQQSGSPLIKRRYEYRDKDSDEEIVVVTRLLTHETVRGYRAVPYQFTVKSVNDQPVKNFAELVALLRDADSKYVEIRFHDTLADILVLDRQKVLDATETILEDNGIVRQGSKDLMKVWESEN